ncbi:MAG: YicC family protein [Candidatus Latescibacteria bacterium]|nr:YicC family protein [Candidatus Latescibacterota bacterium]
MISSMTGFGSGVAESQGLAARVEVRSVNSRFCEVQLRCPSRLQPLEAQVRERVAGRVSRGKVSVVVEWEEQGAVASQPALDEETARNYLRELEKLRQLGGLEGRPDLALVAGLPGVFKVAATAEVSEQAEELVLAALDQALDSFDQMRLAEGAALAADLRARVGQIEARLDLIAAWAAEARDRLREQLRDRINGLLRPGEIPEERLALEVVLLAERSDIAEEVVRFRSHNAQFVAALDKGGEVGRRLNFLLQEQNREANTISSKASEAQIVHLAVEVKEEVERLREQVQNLA